MQTSCSKILSSPHFISLRSFFCIRKAVNIETLSSTAVSFKTELFTSVHSRTVSLPWWLHEENASLCHPRKVHCALSADLPRPRAKRDVNGNEKFLWCTIGVHFEKIKALEIVENLARKQRRSLCEIHRISEK